MLEVYLRPIYQHYIVNPVANFTKNTSPNSITLTACFFGLLSAPAIACHYPLLATFLILFSGFLDTLDGTIARLQKRDGAIGCVLDIVSDRIVEASIMFGLLLYAINERTITTFLMLASCYLCVSAFLVAGIFQKNHSQKSFNYSPGLIERAEAFLFFIMMIWLPGYFYLLGNIFSILVIYTGFSHVKRFLVHQKSIVLEPVEEQETAIA